MPLHTLRSSHEVPLGRRRCVQPENGSQPSSVQGLVSAHGRPVPGMQTPFWHRSRPLQTLLSAHDEPFGSGVPAVHFWFWQNSTPLQVLLSSHSVPGGGTGPGVHCPAWHVSWPLQLSPSPHRAPSGRTVCLQPPAVLSHESFVHWLPSSQFGFGPLRQIPAAHVSSPLHGLPSLHEVPSGGRWPAVQTWL